MRILIVGAGFGGLASAAWLLRDGHRVTVVDCKQNRPLDGFTLGLWSNGMRALEPLGVADRIHAHGLPLYEEFIRDKTGKILAEMDYRPFIAKHGPILEVLHADLYAILQDLAHGASICYETQVESLENGGSIVKAQLSNGLSGEFDLVIGADGSHSRMRDSLFGAEGAISTGVRIWFQLLPPGVLRLSEPNNLFGEGEYVCALPTMDGHVGVEFLAVIPDGEPNPSEGRLAYLRERFNDFDWFVPDLLAALEPTRHMPSFDIEEVTLARWTAGRIVLLGDAAHVVSPTTTLGCSMALEDARILAEELRQVDEGSVEQAIACYEARRKPRLEHVRETGNFLLWWMSIHKPGMTLLRNLGMRLAPPATLLGDMGEIVSAPAVFG